MSNEPQDLGSVLDRTAELETFLDRIIEAFCRPRQKAYKFFSQVLLHSSIISLGAKSKLILAISQEIGFKFEKDKLHRLIALRNAFAHHPLNSHPSLKFGEELGIEYAMTVIGSDGTVNRKSREQALSEFNELQPILIRQLHELRDIIDQSVISSHSA